MCEIKKKRPIKERILILLFFKRTENSESRADESIFRVAVNGDWSTQKEGKIRNKTRARLIQFKGTGKDEVGSKIENKLFIIFKMEFWF